MENSVNSTERWSSSLNGTNFTAAQRMDALNNLNHRMAMAVLPVTIFVAIETVVGFFGNILVLYVFLFHYKQCNFRLFVLCLGVTDLISTLTTMPGEVVSQLFWYTYPNPILCKIKSYCNMLTVSAEALALLTITTDRYLKACRPLGRQISVKTARYIVFAIFTFAVIFSCPVPFFWGIHSTELVYMGVPVTVTICETDQKFIGRTEQVKYSFTMEGILSALMVVMFVLCILIARKLVFQRKELFPRSKQQPMPKIEVIRASTSMAGEQLGNRKAIKGIEEIPDSGFSPSNGLSDVRSDFLRVADSSDDGLSTSSMESVGVERRVRKQPEPHHAHTNHPRARTMKRVRSKTIIMFVLTVTFIVTTVLYLTLLSYITKGILPKLNDTQRATYFFFFRLYFINHVINPIIYGVLDPQFKHVLLKCLPSRAEQSNSNC